MAERKATAVSWRAGQVSPAERPELVLCGNTQTSKQSAGGWVSTLEKKGYLGV